MERLEEIKPNKRYWKKIDSGYNGEVYQIDKENVTKILMNYKGIEAIKMLEKEMILGQKLKEKGISVPNIKGVYLIKNPKSPIVKHFPGLIMEYIEGPTLQEIEKRFPKLENKVRTLRNKELEKAQKLGFGIGDGSINSKNCIWDINNERVVLIDFGWWRYDN